MSTEKKLKEDINFQQKYKSKRLEQQRKVMESLQKKLNLEVTYGDKWTVTNGLDTIVINPNTMSWYNPTTQKWYKYKALNNIIHSKFQEPG